MDQIINLIPAKYHTYIAIAAIALPYVTRAYHALVTGGGLRGIWNGIWFGTNQPRQ